MRYGPPFEFAYRRDGRRLAYQVVGHGDLDLVFLFGWPTHLGLMWENPSFAGFLDKLSSFSRLILFDRLGDGLSDRGPTGHTFDDEMDDVRRVLGAVGSRRAAFFGCHSGGRLALLLAATHPDEVSAVVTFGSHPATLRDADYPWGSTPEEREEVFAAIRTVQPSDLSDRLLTVLAPARPPTPRSAPGTGCTPPRPPARWRRWRGSGRWGRWTSAGSSTRSRCQCWSCTGPGTAWPA
ncbi:MAG TPA: alpha/beta hydrolase [Actinomycetes bacterium]|nr:alpha/beta hydrolase [Actinomycetes bacterium]